HSVLAKRRDVQVVGLSNLAQFVFRPGGHCMSSRYVMVSLGNRLCSGRAAKRTHLRYWASLTFSIQSTFLPLSDSVMAICVIAVVAVAPCQCFSPGGNQTTSPGRISSIGPPSHCTQPRPDVTIRVWPSGWVCHMVRAPGSK